MWNQSLATGRPKRVVFRTIGAFASRDCHHRVQGRSDIEAVGFPEIWQSTSRNG